MVLRATKVSERFAFARLLDRPSAPHGAHALMEQWGALHSGRERLHARLRHEGLEPEAIATAMISGSPAGSSDWVEPFNEIALQAPKAASVTIAPWEERHARTLPYRRLWIPFLMYAVRRIDARRLFAFTSPAARASLETQLLTDLARAGARSAHADAAASEAQGRSVQDRTHELLVSRYAEWLEHRPVLMRRLVETTLQWIATTNEILERFESDAPSIAARFGSAVRRMESIRPGLSDAHGEGRRVARVQFDTGLELAWQPRDIGMLEAWNSLLRGLERLGMPDTPRPLAVLSLRDHGWVSWVDPVGVESAAEARQWFRRAGALLALAHLLNARDLHMDNLIAAHGGPVLVDAEALMQPERWDERDGDAQEKPAATGMLSFPIRSGSGEVRESGGLLGTGGIPLESGAAIWSEKGAAAVVENVPAVSGPAANLPFTPFGAADARTWSNDVAAGFAATLHFVLEHRTLVAERILSCFRGRVARIVLRPTEVYAAAIDRLRSPSRDGDGRDALAVLEQLTRALEAMGDTELWKLAGAEREALERGDIPLFHVSVDSLAIGSDSDAEANGILSRSGMRVVSERLDALNEAAIDQQASEVRATLGGEGDRIDLEESPVPDLSISEETLIAEALQIASDLADAAVKREPARRIALSEFHLDHGRCGEALLFAAASVITNDPRWRELATEWTRELLVLSESPDLPRLVAEDEIGLASGSAGIVYALSVIGELLGSEEHLAAAERFALALAPERIARDEESDLHGGSAGVLLAVAGLLERLPSSAAVSTGSAARDMLLDRFSGPSDNSATPVPSGLAHGLAGIALALARWSRVAVDREAARTSAMLISLESGRWSAGMGNWPTITTAGEKIDMRAWCNGAPGIALARTAMGGEGAGLDRARALASTTGSGLHPVDHVCCGNSGRVEALWHAHLASGDPAPGREARRRAAAMVARARLEGSWRVRLEREANQKPQGGFFKGTAGIGWTLLRVASGDRLPSIAAFESPRRLLAEREIG